MTISTPAPALEDSRKITRMSDLIFMHLAGDDKPLDGLIGEYEKTPDKHEFVLALMAALLTRHRQWQALMSGSDK